MDAFILASAATSATADLARPIAGAPLLVRQLEVLRASGVTRVVVNRVANDPLPPFLHAEALSATGVNVRWIPSQAPLSAKELARRVGAEGAAVVVLPHGLLGDFELHALVRSATQGEGPAAGPGGVWVGTPGDARLATPQETPHTWWVVVSSEQTAQALSEDILAGRRPGIEVRGSEIAPNVWVARGAVIEEGARVEGPVYVGGGAFVARGAHLGPGAIVGEGAIIERGAHVARARVAPGVVVGQGLRVEESFLGAGRVEPHDGEPVAVDDELLVGTRRSRRIFARAAACASYALLFPAAVAAGGKVAGAAGRLARVAAGTGAWVGVGGANDVVFDVEELLLPPGAGAAERAAARTFYRAKKSLALDAKLVVGMLLGGGR